MTNKIFAFILFFAAICDFISAQTEKSTINSLFSSVAFFNDTKIEKFKSGGKEYEVYLKEPNNNILIPKTYNVSGSGFFVNNQGSAYLVTAEHVSKLLTLNTDVIIRGENDKPMNLKLKELIAIKDTLEWTYHKQADVATILLDISSKIFSFIKTIPFEIIVNNRVPMREREVTTIGFPLELGFEKHFSPISKVSKPSSGLVELRRADNNKLTEFFLLDDPSISGFSGAPVLELPTQLVYGKESIHIYTIELVGLVHGTISEKNGGGFAAITPSKYIIETINSSPKYSGISRQYHNNGQLWTERIYKDGLILSVLSNYDKNGNSVDKGTLLNGNGTLNLYDEEGRLYLIETYKDGILIESKDVE
jgi:hypothetical protein